MARFLLLLLSIATVAASCGTDGNSGAGSTEVASATPAATAEPRSTPSSPPQMTTTPLVEVTGLFVEPRDPPPVIARPLGARPPSPFRPWDGASTILYDVVEGAEVNLGPGLTGQFSPDGTRMAWVRGDNFASGEAFILDLQTMEERSLGPARMVYWGDDEHVSLTRGNNSEILNLETGERTPGSGLGFYPASDVTLTPEGFNLRREGITEDQHPASRWHLTDPGTETLLLSFEAYRAVPAGRGWLAIATPIQLSGPVGFSGVRSGTTNILLVEIATGEATFVATSPWNYANWPLQATERYVAWTDAYCGQPAGTTKVLDRSSGEIADLGQTLWIEAITDDGRLATDSFGPRSLIDIETLSYEVVLPGGEPAWSADWRYASIGLVGGHGGLCP